MASACLGVALRRWQSWKRNILKLSTRWWAQTWRNTLFPKTGEKSAEQPTQIHHSHPLHVYIKRIAEPPMLSDKCACSQLFFLQQLQQQQSLKWAGKCNGFSDSPAPYLHGGACCFDTSTVQCGFMLWYYNRAACCENKPESQGPKWHVRSVADRQHLPSAHTHKCEPLHSPTRTKCHHSHGPKSKTGTACPFGNIPRSTSVVRLAWTNISLLPHVGRCRPSMIVHDLTCCSYRHTISFLADELIFSKWFRGTLYD